MSSSSSSDSSNSSELGGNTKPPNSQKKKQISPAKRWCFTLNNYSASEFSSIVPIIKDHCSLGIIGIEKGKKGTPHLQGYFEFKTKRRPKGVFNNNRIHFEKCKGTRQQNLDYCRKEGNVEFEFNCPRALEILPSDKLFQWQKDILSLVATPCRMGCRRLNWYWGAPGIGKTQFLKYLCFHHNAVMLDGERRHLFSMAAKAPDRCEIFIMSLPYGENEIDFGAIEKIKDGLFADHFGSKMNGMVIRNSPHILVFANEPPNRYGKDFHPEKWVITELP